MEIGTLARVGSLVWLGTLANHGSLPLGGPLAFFGSLWSYGSFDGRGSLAFLSAQSARSSKSALSTSTARSWHTVLSAHSEVGPLHLYGSLTLNAARLHTAFSSPRTTLCTFASSAMSAAFSQSTCPSFAIGYGFGGSSL